MDVRVEPIGSAEQPVGRLVIDNLTFSELVVLKNWIGNDSTYGFCKLAGIPTSDARAGMHDLLFDKINTFLESFHEGI